MSPPDDLLRAARLLREGGLVAFPTETVYGLGADATSPAAVARIFAAKGRPRFNPLISHVATLDQARAEGVFAPDAERLAAALWPGPLTLVLPRAPAGTVCDLACAGLGSIGLRIPAHAWALDLIRSAARPIAAPSANRSGRLSPTRAADVETDLGHEVEMVLDGGACAVGVESTIVACLEGAVTILRPGGIAQDAIERVLGRALAPADRTAEVIAPGMLTSHYAPTALLRLDAADIVPGEAGLDFARQFGGTALDLSPSGDLTEAAANLFSYLRRLDGADPHAIAVAPVPEVGLGVAINDRLRRAAAPRGAG